MPLYDRSTSKMNSQKYIKNRFISAGENLNIIANRMVQNDKLIKLLVRNDKGVLDDETPVTDEEKAIAFQEHISTIPVTDKDIETKTKIVLQIADIIPNETGLSYNISFDILCNIDVWNLDSPIQRPYAILNEIDEILSDTKIKSLGPVTLIGATSLKINERMLGYTMVFNFAEIQ